MTRLLIVDDKQENLYMLQVLLSANGFQVELASNGAEALERARRAPPDLIISDILMPVMDGFALCRAWKEDGRLKDIPFVFYTATYTDPKDEDFALSLGAERFIVKPIEPDKFLALLLETIETHKAGQLTATCQPAEEATYYKEYNAVLVHKLEDKMLQLAEANRILERDIAEIKRAEEQLQSLAKFPSENPHPVLRVARDGILLHANPASQPLLRLWGCQVGERLPAAWWSRLAEAYDAERGEEAEIACEGRFYSISIVPIAPFGYVNLYGHDSTKRKHAEQQLQQHALRDALTGLFNRLVFTDHLTLAFERAKRSPAYRYAVLFLDLDRFKVINDSLGHFAGDTLLIAVARRLEKRLRAADTLARLGGDEFAILLDNSSEGFDAVRVAHRLEEELNPAFTVEGREVFTTVSIGIAESRPTYERPEELLRDADSALYRAKALGGARFAVFDAAMHERAVALLHLETELRRALERQEIRVYYQPIVSLATEQLYGFETLIRWQHPTRGLLVPENFISLAEETGLMIPIGEWMLREACSQMRRWQTRFSASPPLTISVNLSYKQFLQPNLIELVTRTLQETGLAPQQLCLEITENVILQQEQASGIIRDLRDLGVQLHIDDFGAGYSSFGALRHVEITALKIDRAFVRMLDGTNRQSAIARAAVLLARELGLTTIAEGVETPEQFAYLKTVECEYGQGYLFAKPMDSEAATGLLVSVLQPKA